MYKNITVHIFCLKKPNFRYLTNNFFQKLHILKELNNKFSAKIFLESEIFFQTFFLFLIIIMNNHLHKLCTVVSITFMQNKKLLKIKRKKVFSNVL